MDEYAGRGPSSPPSATGGRAETFHEATFGAAAPIFDPAGRPLAAIALALPMP